MGRGLIRGGKQIPITPWTGSWAWQEEHRRKGFETFSGDEPLEVQEAKAKRNSLRLAGLSRQSSSPK